MTTAELDFAVDNEQTGFRLQRLEVLNWGTFHQHIWQLDPAGHNTLLTGDIGSGKSTLVDAVTTLLVRGDRIVFNKAAGAEGKERSLSSYVRGEYKSEQDSFTQNAKPIALRDEKSYSVLLAYFYNSGFDQGATLAQVFWIKEGQIKPERFFVFAETQLSIKQRFTGFGTDVRDLKKALRKLAHVKVMETFKEYSTGFRRMFGIRQEQALDLFYQTVSMKSVGNLTRFVRTHMLDKFDVEQRIDELRRAFDNLNRAHESVLKAKRQIEALQPLVSEGERHAALCQEIDSLSACRDDLAFWFAGHKVKLSELRIKKLAREIGHLSNLMRALRDDIKELRIKEDTLKAGIEDNGGSRLRAIDNDLQRLHSELQRQQTAHARYHGHCEQLSLSMPTDADQFQANRNSADDLMLTRTHQLHELDQQRTDKAIESRKFKDQGDELDRELESLRQRKSNIPRQQLLIRQLLLEDLGLTEDALPFVGELLQVDEQELAWEGAIERLLHNFGQSLLVQDEHYAAVSGYVEQTRLKGRLVYYRVRDKDAGNRRQATDPRALYRKLLIRPEGRFYLWLDAWLARNYDHVCCSELAEFRRLPKAITVRGQIKSGGRRHEKDDRTDIDDRSRFILGWSNEEKIKVLVQQRDLIAAALQTLFERIQSLDQDRDQRLHQKQTALLLLETLAFEHIDWQVTTGKVQDLEDEKRQIEDQSDTLTSLRTQLRIVKGAIEKKEAKERVDLAEEARLGERLNAKQDELQAAQKIFAGWTDEQQQVTRDRIESLHLSLPEQSKLTLKNLDNQQHLLRQGIQQEINSLSGKRNRSRDTVISRMQAYKGAYQAETTEVDAAMEALTEYMDMLDALENEDLPRHESRFREMLKEDTIQGVAMFQAQLDKQQREIDEKINAINTSLAEIEYAPGTYITLVKDATPDTEIRDFKQQLKQVLSGSLDEAELYTQEKFLQVKQILDRFNGRDGLVDQDRRWTIKVTDVRNWFNFSASERYSEDDQEKEFYSDTAGKSGGQKEKLAYTILASALAYQFGLEWGQVRSRSFRFVVIDEAFGKGSDESTRYALELFKKLDLQLLIVTPLQKIHVIEDYIRGVHFVHNQDGRHSLVRNLTIEEYEREKLDFKQ